MNMDSFMDIVTNVIGLMILIAAAIIINASEISMSLGSPMLRRPPQDAKPVFFDCAHRRVVPRDADSLIQTAKSKLDQYHMQLGHQPGYIADAQWLNTQRISSQAYDLEYKAGSEWLGIQLTTKDENQGDLAVEVIGGDSQFAKTISELDPSTHYLYFIVREDSFGVFRTARKIAREKGFAVGWNPKHSKYPLLHYLVGIGWGNDVQ